MSTVQQRQRTKEPVLLVSSTDGRETRLYNTRLRETRGIDSSQQMEGLSTLHVYVMKGLRHTVTTFTQHTSPLLSSPTYPRQGDPDTRQNKPSRRGTTEETLKRFVDGSTSAYGNGK